MHLVVTTVLLLLFSVVIPCPAHAAGVTLITHGFKANARDWVIPMGQAVTRYPNSLLTGFSAYEMYFELESNGTYAVRQRRLGGDGPLSASSGEIVIALDWSQFAGELFDVSYSTTKVAPAVAAALLNPNFIPELQGRPIVELPIHLIGHSRGASLWCEVTKQLGQEGLWIDHLTTLDPHPLNNHFDDTLTTFVVDGPAVPYVNVLFADNYYQVNNSFFGNDPSGQYVVGAYNRRLNIEVGGYTGLARRHSNAHLWYHGTTDWGTPVTDTQSTITQAERQGWWTLAESNGILAGFHYSLLSTGDRRSDAMPAGGTNRVSDGLNQIWNFGVFRGPNRYALPLNSGRWPNLLTFNVEGTNQIGLTRGRTVKTVSAGNSLPMRFQYQFGGAPQSELTVRIFLDTDFNPHTGPRTLVHTSSALPKGITQVFNFEVPVLMDSRMVAPDAYTVGAEITDGFRTRYLYAPEIVLVRASSDAPVLSVSKLNTDDLALDLAGQRGQTVVLEATTDFLSWSPIATNISTGSSWRFVDELSRDKEMRFYRGRVVW